MASLYDQFLELIPKGGRILDAGCGSGRDSLAFMRKGFQVTALDGSPVLAEAARSLTELDVVCRRFQEIEFSGEFDGIWACASLLHVPKREIDRVFPRFIRALKPKGHWYMSFKYGETEESRSGRFFNDYTDLSLKGLLQHYGEIEICRIWTTKDVRKTKAEQTWVNAIVRRKAEIEGS